MPSRLQTYLRLPVHRVLTLLFCCIAAVPASARAAACGQSQAVELSDTARAVAAINASLSGGGTSGLTGATGLRASVATSLAGSDSGKTLIRSRADLVRQLMQTHPEEVRSVMLPAETTAALIAADPANAALLEHEANLAGDLAASVIDRFDDRTSQQVFSLHDASTAERIALHPATSSFLLGSLLHRPVAVTGVQLGADIAADTISPATPAGAPQVALHSLALQAAAISSTSTTLTCSATATQSTAVILLQFPNNTPAFPGAYGTAAWWKQAIAGGGTSVNALWSEMTAGATQATVDVYGPLTLAQNYGCADYLAMRTAALTLAAKSVDLSKYTRIVLGFPASTCTFGGLADLGCNGADKIIPHPYSVVWMPIMTTYTASTGVWGSLAHELGHNLGLNHANSLDFGAQSLGPLDFQATNPGTVGGTGATTATGGVTAVDTEYGDSFSAMGSPWVSGPGPYSAEHRAKLLGWIPVSGSNNGFGSITAGGSYDLLPASGGNGLRALRVLRDAASSSWLWLEYRNGGTAFDAANLAAIKGQNASSGAVIHYENGYADHDKTYELDMTPSAKGNNFADGALAVGKSWSDPYSPLTLSVNSIGPNGLNVSVKYDSTCASFTVGTDPIASAGGSGTVKVTAAAGCTWTVSANASWLQLDGTTSGTGNGSFAWAAAANTGVGQRVTYLTVGRQSQRLLQLGSGANVVALSPQNATVTPGSSSVLTLTLNDTAGAADLSSVTLNALAAGAQPCTVLTAFSGGTPVFYLLENTSGDYTSGVTAGGSGTVSTSGCSLTGKGSGMWVSGSTMTLAWNLTFPASAPGARGLFASANSGTELPVGILNVGTVAVTQTPPTTTQPTTLKATATTLSGAPVTALPGAPVVLTAAVAAAPGGSGVPTGKLTILDGSTTISTLALDAAGKASYTTTALSNGTHALTAVYAGDGSFAASTSAATSVTIAQAATTATLTASAAAVAVGGNATLTVKVAGVTGSAAPTGAATLKDGSATLTTSALSGGSATFSLSGLLAGTHTYTVSYGGDATYLPSTSNAVAVTAGKPAATLSLTSAAVVLAGSKVVVTVTAAGGAAVTGTTAAAPTGTVQVQEGSRSLGALTLTNGVGTLDAGTMLAGSHTITASYAGDSNFDAATAAAITVNVVDFAMTGPGMQADISVKAGATSGNTATLALTPGSTGFPIAVSFACNGAPALATCTVTPGSVTPGSNPMPVTVTVTTTASGTGTAAGWLGLPLLGLLAHSRTRRSSLRLVAMLCVTAAFGFGLTGCGTGVVAGPSTTAVTGSSSGTPIGNSVLTVTAMATSNGVTLAHTATVTLQVR